MGQAATASPESSFSINWKECYPAQRSSARNVSAVSCAASPTRPLAARPVKIRLAGDSITQGCCDGLHLGYRYFLWDALKRHGHGANFEFVGFQRTIRNPRGNDTVAADIGKFYPKYEQFLHEAPQHEGHSGAMARDLWGPMEEILAESGGGQVGRPHMARALMKKGYVGSVQEAFDQYLADGKPLHVPKVKLNPAEAIDLVRSKRGADGCWPLDVRYPGQRPIEIDDGEGKPSRWNTLRALRVLEWYSEQG